MKWIIAAACLTCTDPSPQPLLVIENSSAATCKALAILSLKHTLPFMPEGTIAASWCIGVDDWRPDEPYPQARRVKVKP